MTIRRLFVEVTARHIALGDYGQCATCPVAQAINDACAAAGLPWKVLVGGAGIWSTSPGRDWIYQIASIPSELNVWIVRFDGGVKVGPTSFYLDLRIPAEAVES